MFETLSEKLNKVFKKVKGHGKLTEKNIQDALKEVRLALLEADVNYRVVKNLINSINTFVENSRKNRSANITITELSRLSEKELRDIGINRGDIYSIAYGDSDFVRGSK